MHTWWQVARDYPLAWIVVVAIVAVAVSVLVVLDLPTMVALAVIAIGAVVAALAPLGYRGKRDVRRRASERWQRTSADRADLRQLQAELDALEDPRPSYQFHAIGEKRDNLIAILARRMEAGELTFARYRASAQQVHEAVISNLREVSIASSAISAIDLAYIEARLTELAGATADAAQAEATSLRDRRALVQRIPLGVD